MGKLSNIHDNSGWKEIYNLPAKVDESKNEWIIIFEIGKNVRP